MLLLILGLVLFLGVHLVPSQLALKEGLKDRFGSRAYQLGFTAVSLLGLVLIVYGYGKVQMLPGKNPQLWVPPTWAKHLLWLLMLPSLILIVAANLKSRIRTAAGHPMLVGTKIWAFGHLLANGTLASMLLFGSFLAWALFDLISVKRRNSLGPLGASPGTLTGDIIAVVAGTALWAFMLFWGHAKLIGVALIS